MPNEKFFTNNSGDEQDDTLCAPWFKIDTKNVKFIEVPTTGEEFLISVIAERKNIDVVTKCDVDYSKFNKNQSRFYEEVPVASAPYNLKPTIEWQNIQVADFSDIRMYISRMLNKPPAERKKIRKVIIKKDDISWWENYFNVNEPSLSCVLGFSAAHLDRGLEMLIQIIKEITPGDSIDHKTGKWIYSFLACKKQPLISDTISIIRDLARCCAEIRSRINPEAENASELAMPLNLIICIVGRYFRQLDLADNRD